MKTTAQQLQFCRKEEEALRRQIQMLSSRSRLFIIGDILSFLGIVFFLVLITLSDDSTMRLAEGVLVQNFVDGLGDGGSVHRRAQP